MHSHDKEKDDEEKHYIRQAHAADAADKTKWALTYWVLDKVQTRLISNNSHFGTMNSLYSKDNGISSIYI